MNRSTWHRVLVTNPETKTGNCSICGDGVRLRRRVRDGAVAWSCLAKQRTYSRGARLGSIRSYRRANTGTCTECGFEAIHPAQIDVHHADGDHNNGCASNLVSLCANCHRLWHAMGDAGMATAAARRGDAA